MLAFVVIDNCSQVEIVTEDINIAIYLLVEKRGADRNKFGEVISRTKIKEALDNEKEICLYTDSPVDNDWEYKLIKTNFIRKKKIKKEN